MTDHLTAPDTQNDRYRNPDNDPRGAWAATDLTFRNDSCDGMYSIKCPSGRIIEGPPQGRYWSISEEKFRELDADKRIWWGKDGDSMPSLKRYLSDLQEGVSPQTNAFQSSRQWRRMTRYSFDNFIVGTSNRVAYDAAKSAVSSPGQMNNNPLVIYGGIGLGKSHLLQAIANQFASDHPKAKVSYLHCERFVADVVRAYQTNKFDEFKGWFHNLDLLLIDDIQFISGKIKSQEELTIIVETLLEHDKQVVFSGDQLPQDMSAVHPKLLSLIQAGNMIAIAPPELELRTGIIMQELRSLPDVENEQEVATYIAEIVHSDGRQIIGAVNRMRAYASSNQQAPNLDMAKLALKDITEARARRSQ